MVWVICIHVLMKPVSINNYLMSLISNTIVLFPNVSKATLSIILLRNRINEIKNTSYFLHDFLFSFLSLSNLI